MADNRKKDDCSKKDSAFNICGNPSKVFRELHKEPNYVLSELVFSKKDSDWRGHVQNLGKKNGITNQKWYTN